jgi:hypothetical protein
MIQKAIIDSKRVTSAGPNLRSISLIPAPELEEMVFVFQISRLEESILSEHSGMEETQDGPTALVSVRFRANDQELSSSSLVAS